MGQSLAVGVTLLAANSTPAAPDEAGKMIRFSRRNLAFDGRQRFLKL